MGTKSILEHIQSKSDERVIRITGRTINSTDLDLIKGFLLKTKASTLSLIGCSIDNETIKNLVNIILRNKSYRILTIFDTKLNAKKVNALLNPLWKNQHNLSYISLGYNNIDDMGALAIANFIDNNQVTKTLRVDGNNIGDKGAQYIAEPLKNDKTLKRVSTSFNPITEKGVESLFKVLESNHSLEDLEVETVNIAKQSIRSSLSGPKEKLVNSSSELEHPITKANITTAINEACDKYLAFLSELKNKSILSSKPLEHQRGKLGFFTRFRHGDKGRKRANKLKSDINGAKDWLEALDTISSYFNEKNRRLNKHSLSSYLLDELHEIKHTKWSELELKDDKYSSSDVKNIFSNTPRVI